MAIGDISASGGLSRETVVDRTSSHLVQRSNDLSQAVNRFASSAFEYMGSQTRIAEVYDKRAMASESVDLDTRFLEYQNENAKLYTDFARDRSSNPLGMSKDFDAQLQEREKAFLATVPERHKEEYAAKLKQDRSQRTASTWTAEVELLDHVDGQNLTKSMNTLGSALKGGTIDLETAKESFAETVMKSGLPEQAKVELIQSGNAQLEGLEFGDIVENAAKGYGVANSDASGADVVASGLTPYERGFLNAVSSVEAKAYNIWNGGGTFNSYADHPANLGVKTPGESSAAGRYQFVVGTWNAARKSYEQTYGTKVPDFSPQWQDRVALHWAEVQFNRRNKEGLTWRGVLNSGDPAQLAKLRSVLGNPFDPTNPRSVEWQGLGDAAGMTDAQFLGVLTGEKGVAGGGTGPASLPNVWTDPRFTNITLEDKLKFSSAASTAAEQYKLGQSEQIKNEVKAFNDSMYERGYASGDLNLIDELRKSPMWSGEADRKFRDGVIAFNEKEVSISEVERQRAAGIPMDPNNTKAMKGYNQWFGEGTVAGLAGGEAWAYEKLRGATSQFGVMPSDARDALKAAMTNPTSRFQALEFLASLQAGDPSVLYRSGFTEDDLAPAMRYKSLAGQGSQEEAQARFVEMEQNIQKLGLNPGKAKSEALTYYQETYDSDDLLGKFMGTLDYANGMDVSKLNPSFLGQLNVDAAEAFQNGYLTTGSMEGAEEYMTTYLERVYGTSYTNKTMGEWPSKNVYAQPVPMKYPPEKYYPPADGGHEYIYSAMETFAAGNLPPGTEIRTGTAILISDSVTEQQMRNGEPPTYRMVAQGEYGEVLVIPDRFGGSYLNDAADTVNKSVADQELAKVELTTSADIEAYYAETVRSLPIDADPLVKAEAERGLEAARERKARARESAVAVNVPVFDTSTDPLAQPTLQALSVIVQERNISPELEGQVVDGLTKVQQLTNTPRDAASVSRQISTATDEILAKAKRAGTKVDRATAQTDAIVAMLQKKLSLDPAVAALVAEAWLKGNAQ